MYKTERGVCLDFDILLGLLCILSIMYFIIDYVKDFVRKIKVKLKTTTICESIIEVEITNKYFIKGYPLQPHPGKGKYLMPTRVDSYLVEFHYKDIDHTINSKDIFKEFDIGNIIKIKLIEKIDKNNLVISYKFINL